MTEILDDQENVVIALNIDASTIPSYIRVRDDALLEEVIKLRSAVEAILKRLESV